MAENNTDKEALKAAKEAEKAAEKAKKERIRQSKPKKTNGNPITRAGGAVKKFWKDFIGTVKKIVWPSAGQVLKSSLVVLVTIILIGLVVYGIDQGLQEIRGKHGGDGQRGGDEKGLLDGYQEA